jgi:hypothetical protein
VAPEYPSPPTPLHQAIEGNRREVLHQAMEELPDLYRTALHLHYWLGCPVEEIAEYLGRSARHGQVLSAPRPRAVVSHLVEERNNRMKDPANADRLLALLRMNPSRSSRRTSKPGLRRALNEPSPQPAYARAVRYGALAFMLFSAALLAGYDYCVGSSR